MGTQGGEYMNRTCDVDASNFEIHSSMLHDMICEGWKFDYACKRLTLMLNRGMSENNAVKVIFHNVFAHKMVSCDFWGPSPHLLSWSMVDTERECLYQQIQKEITQNEYGFSRFDSAEQYIESVIQFISGDMLDILCQRISIEERDMHKPAGEPSGDIGRPPIRAMGEEER